MDTLNDNKECTSESTETEDLMLLQQLLKSRRSGDTSFYSLKKQLTLCINSLLDAGVEKHIGKLSDSNINGQTRMLQYARDPNTAEHICSLLKEENFMLLCKQEKECDLLLKYATRSKEATAVCDALSRDPTVWIKNYKFLQELVEGIDENPSKKIEFEIIKMMLDSQKTFFCNQPDLLRECAKNKEIVKYFIYAKFASFSVSLNCINIIRLGRFADFSILPRILSDTVQNIITKFTTPSMPTLESLALSNLHKYGLNKHEGLITREEQEALSKHPSFQSAATLVHMGSLLSWIRIGLIFTIRHSMLFLLARHQIDDTSPESYSSAMSFLQTLHDQMTNLEEKGSDVLEKYWQSLLEEEEVASLKHISSDFTESMLILCCYDHIEELSSSFTPPPDRTPPSEIFDAFIKKQHSLEREVQLEESWKSLLEKKEDKDFIASLARETLKHIKSKGIPVENDYVNPFTAILTELYFSKIQGAHQECLEKVFNNTLLLSQHPPSKAPSTTIVINSLLKLSPKEESHSEEEEMGGLLFARLAF